MYINRPATFTDYYQLTMAQGYLLSGRSDMSARFDYFFRKHPFDGGYTIFAGLEDLLDTLTDYRFYEDELEYLHREGFSDVFIEHLDKFHFEGRVESVREGEIVFPGEPVVSISGTLLETQLIETLLLNILNFQSLIATKASRIKQAAGERPVLDFGLRRSHGLGGIHASRAARIGGVDGTSNVYSAMAYDLSAGGTMAHSWVQSFTDEIEAFRTYADIYNSETLLLIDTYDTLGSGLPNAIKIADELRSRGESLKGVRLDSGDLAYLSRQVRKRLDREGFEEVRIVASNQLDEHVIESLTVQEAPIDIFGVGTRLVTGQESSALDGVYKLSEIDGRPTFKYSDNTEKMTLPGSRIVRRFVNQDGRFEADAILVSGESDPKEMIHPTNPTMKKSLSNLDGYSLLEPVMERGKRLGPTRTVDEISKWSANQLERLSEEHKRFDHPHIYKVGLSPSLHHKRNRLIEEVRQSVNR